MGQNISVQAAIAFGTAGCPFKSEANIALTAAQSSWYFSTAYLGTLVDPTAGAIAAGTQKGPGWFQVITSPNDVVEYSPDAGTTWRLVIPQNSYGVFYSDGWNWRLRNLGEADVSGAVYSIVSQIDFA